MSRQTFSAEQWRALIQRQRASGLTVQAFCRREGLAPSTFFRWQKQLRQQQGRIPDSRSPESEPGGFVELTREAPAELQAKASASEPIELVLADQRVVRVRKGFDPATLRQLVEALS